VLALVCLAGSPRRPGSPTPTTSPRRANHFKRGRTLYLPAALPSRGATARVDDEGRPCRRSHDYAPRRSAHGLEACCRRMPVSVLRRQAVRTMPRQSAASRAGRAEPAGTASGVFAAHGPDLGGAGPACRSRRCTRSRVESAASLTAGHAAHRRSQLSQRAITPVETHMAAHAEAARASAAAFGDGPCATACCRSRSTPPASRSCADGRRRSSLSTGPQVALQVIERASALEVIAPRRRRRRRRAGAPGRTARQTSASTSRRELMSFPPRTRETKGRDDLQ